MRHPIYTAAAAIFPTRRRRSMYCDGSENSNDTVQSDASPERSGDVLGSTRALRPMSR